MNDDERSLDESEGTDLAETLAQLRRLEPSMAARLANRAAVTAELRAIEAADVLRERPWWRRSISVPMPVAASLLALLAITAPMSAAAWLKAGETAERPAATTNDHPQNHFTTGDSRIVARRQPAESPGYSVTETYLCGVGRINSNARYSKTENTP